MKKGSSAITLPLVIIISIIFIVVFSIFVINMILPFIYYEKLQHISYKYMYIIEKYGYLTYQEEQNLLDDLEKRGFDKKSVRIECPKEAKGYGNLIEFNLTYSYKQKFPIFKGNLRIVTRVIPINVNKTIISKV